MNYAREIKYLRLVSYAIGALKGFHTQVDTSMGQRMQRVIGDLEIKLDEIIEESQNELSDVRKRNERMD